MKLKGIERERECFFLGILLTDRGNLCHDLPFGLYYLVETTSTTRIRRLYGSRNTYNVTQVGANEEKIPKDSHFAQLQYFII